jgi:hypothetical protein
MRLVVRKSNIIFNVIGASSAATEASQVQKGKVKIKMVNCQITPDKTETKGHAGLWKEEK